MTTFWYVLFVETGKENESVREIAKGGIEGVQAFVPMYNTKFRNSGKIVSEKKRLFPGYIFVEAEIPGLEFYASVRRLVVRSEHILKVLKYGNGYLEYLFEMKEEEVAVFQKLWNCDCCVEMSQGVIVGDRIVISDGPLFGFESYIKRINRHKMEATLELELMGDKREVIVGLEVVKKVSDAGALV